MKQIIVFLGVVVFGVVLPVRVARADLSDAIVLPKGVFEIHLDGMFSLPITQRYDKDGNIEDLATDFNVNLNSDVFSELSLVEMGFGLPAGSATFGQTEVEFERHIRIFMARTASDAPTGASGCATSSKSIEASSPSPH